MLFRKLIRTAGKYKAQFISMIVMTALGIGMFLGFNMEWVSINENTFSFFDATCFADYRIMSEDGFTDKDADRIARLDGVDDLSRFISVNADVKGSDSVLAVTVTENFDVSNFLILEGEAYDSESTDGIWLFDRFADATGIGIGDKLELSYDSLTFTGTVKGLIESSEYLICVQDETQLMPAFDKFGYCYISPAMLEQAVRAEVEKEGRSEIVSEMKDSMMEGYDEAQAGLEEAKNELDQFDEIVANLKDAVAQAVAAGMDPQMALAAITSDPSFAEAAKEFSTGEGPDGPTGLDLESIENSLNTWHQNYTEAVAEAEEVREKAERLETMSDDELSDLLEEYTDKTLTATYDEAMNEAMDNIYHQINVISSLDKAEFKEKVNGAIGKTLVVLSKDENISYAESQGEAEEGKTMGSILPVLFLLISVLTMVTTMHRIATNEKTQIGTLKALGFKDRRILWHYSSYTLMIALLGTVLGIALGYLVCWIIMNPNGMMGTYFSMPEWKLVIPWWCWIVIAAIILLMFFVGRASTKEILKGNAADALRPFVPTAGKPMLIEKTKLWERSRFGTKWNLRDIMRHKSRSIVTLIGVIGCMVLMVAAIGMYETANAFIQMVYTDNARYASKIFISDSATEDETIELAKKYDADYSASVSVQLDDDTYSLDIYHIENDLIRFMDADGGQIELTDDGALVCMRIAEKHSLKIGDMFTVSPYGTDEKYDLKVSGIYRSVSESVVISEEYAKQMTSGEVRLTESERYHIGSLYTAIEKSQIDEPLFSAVQSKKDITDSMNNFMEIMNTFVIVLVVAAIVLGIVVLYNLGVMSYTERYREMATLKVVGFRDNKLKGLLIGQNMWLTVIGIVLGFFAGYGILVYLMKALAPEYEMKIVIGPMTIIISIAITFAVSLVVGLMVSGKCRKIDMVDALKIPE